MFIYSNLATSLDGKIAATDRRKFVLGTKNDHLKMEELRKTSDAILTGSSTLRVYKLPYRARGSQQPINIILSSSLKGISPTWPFFKDSKIPRILFVTSKLHLAKLRAFEKNSQVIELNQKPVAPQIVKELESRGLKRLLIEGGGSIMWEFVKYDLIDEYHVTLTPWMIGGERAPTLVDGIGFASKNARKLKLLESNAVGDELFVRYKRV